MLLETGLHCPNTLNYSWKRQYWTGKLGFHKQKTFNINFKKLFIIKVNIARLQNAAQRSSHLLLRCQVVLTKKTFKKKFFFHKLTFVKKKLLCINLGFWVWSQFEFLSCHNLVFNSDRKCCCVNFFYYVNFVTFWVFELSHFEFLSLLQFEFLSLTKLWVVWCCQN